MSRISFLFLGLVLLSRASAFTCPRPAVRFASPFSAALAANKDDEIAELEKKLQQLKEAAVEEEEKVVAAAEAVSEEIPVNAPNQLEEPMLEMLSESWKETDPSQSSEGGILLPILGAVLAVVFLVGFSQVPVGQQDLSKYSAVKTSSQIDLGDLNEARKKVTEGL
jgi:hypothetical protein